MAASRAARAATFAAAAAIVASAGAAGVAAPDGLPPEDAALAAALPADPGVDLALVDHPAVPGAPHVRVATRAAATAAAIKALLLDPARYRAIIPSLVRADRARSTGGLPAVAWELEVPLFNLSGTFALRERADGVELAFVAGDFAPGRIVFAASPRGPAASALVVDATLDVRRSTWLIRHVIARSPVGESAALAAATYVAARAVALAAERPTRTRAWRPSAPFAPPARWPPDTRALDDVRVSGLAARGALAAVARAPSERLAGVAVAVAVPSIDDAARWLRDPSSFGAFPGWRTVHVVPGANGPGAEVEDNLPLVDLDAVWSAEPGPPARWTATAGAARGARLAWELYPARPSAPALAVLSMYPRLEATGTVPRRFIAAEPLLEAGLALALGFADATACRGVLDAQRHALH